MQYVKYAQRNLHSHAQRRTATTKNMIEYKDIREEYVNGEKRIYDENNNLLAIEHENGKTEFFNPNED